MRVASALALTVVVDSERRCYLPCRGAKQSLSGVARGVPAWLAASRLRVSCPGVTRGVPAWPAAACLRVVPPSRNTVGTFPCHVRFQWPH